MAYVPRLTAPSSTDLNWILKSYGGKNPCIQGSSGVRNSALPNCTGYVVGRWLELFGDYALNLPWQYNAGEYWTHTNSMLATGSVPKLGAVGCYLDTTGAAGHVLIVEQVNADGSFVSSESAWGGTRFYTQTLRPPGYTWSSRFKFQGFIYNPKSEYTSAEKIEAFVKAAKDCIGKRASDLGFRDSDTCSTEFVVYCAKQVDGLVGTVIPDSTNSTEFTASGVEASMGTFLKGPLYNRPFVPKAGDVLLERKSRTRKYKSDSDCDTLHIVTGTGDSYVDVVSIEGSGRIIASKFKDTSKVICGYYRPKWSLVGNNTSGMLGYAPLGKFYETENTKEDATIRQVGYLDSENKPTIEKSGIALSIVNYTTLLSSVMDDLLVPCIVSGNIGTDVIVDGVDDPKAKEVIQYLTAKGLNAAAACGICGNIKHESNFNTAAVGDYGTSFGICQWHYGRGDRMKQMAGSGWANNLTGQLDYLWSELQSGYSASTLQPIQAVPNTEQGARQAADIFVRNFEIPADVDNESLKRQATAAGFFASVTIQMTTSSSGSSRVTTKAVSGQTIEVPSWVPQAGIDTTYSNYPYLYNIWGKSTRQYQVSRIWDNKGRKSNRNIATIDGRYLVALKPIFGVSGDKVSIILTDGTVINCIIADSKGNENEGVAFADYGHTSGISGRANIVEWEGFDPNGTPYMRSRKIDLSGWANKNVKKIINGGSIL